MPKQNIRDAEKLHHSWAADGNVEDKFSLKRLLKQSYLRTPKTKQKKKKKQKIHKQEGEKHQLELHP